MKKTIIFAEVHKEFNFLRNLDIVLNAKMVAVSLLDHHCVIALSL